MTPPKLYTVRYLTPDHRRARFACKLPHHTPEQARAEAREALPGCKILSVEESEFSKRNTKNT